MTRIKEDDGLPEAATTADAATPKSAAITHEWLSSCGFKWHQHERQPHKHWVLNLGWAVDGAMFSTATDLYIEVTPAWWQNRNGERVQAGRGDPWNCWIGGEGRGFIHVRHLQFESDLTQLIEALTGLPWNPDNVVYGQLRTPDAAAKLKADRPDDGAGNGTASTTDAGQASGMNQNEVSQ